MIGNVYVKFIEERDAEAAVESVNNRWFNGEPVYAELSPVTDFRESRCRQHEQTGCNKGGKFCSNQAIQRLFSPFSGYCNFMHIVSEICDHFA